MGVREHFVYVIARRDGDALGPPCKVGISASPAVRLEAIQTAAPFKLGLYAVFLPPGGYSAHMLERDLHGVFADFNAHGEWFNISPKKAAFTLALGVYIQLVKDGFPKETASEMSLNAMKFIAE